jgi:hypothetical protein
MLVPRDLDLGQISQLQGEATSGMIPLKKVGASDDALLACLARLYLVIAGDPVVFRSIRAALGCKLWQGAR